MNLVTQRLQVNQVKVVTVVIFALSLGISLSELRVPEVLSAYDSGVYLVGSMHLVAGVLPYRDFTFVQPPGILLLMSPIALLSHFIGVHSGYVVARISGSLITALNAALLSWIVRSSGRVAMVIAGGGLALLPVAMFVNSSLTLEPYLICLVLLGSLAILNIDDHDQSRSSRFILGGILFGLAASVKLWAVFPFTAMVVIATAHYGRRALSCVGAAFGAFTLICLPFLVSSPRNFLSEVFSQQLLRSAGPNESASIAYRLVVFTGFQPTTIAPSKGTIFVVVVGVMALVVAGYSIKCPRSLAEVYLLVAAGLSICALLVSSEFFNYYGYFTAPFILGAVGIAIARLYAPLGDRLRPINVSRGVRAFLSWSARVGGTILVVALILYSTTFYSVYAWAIGLYQPWFTSIAQRIPANSCVVYAEVSYGVLSNRTSSNARHCPVEVDSYGMWMRWGDRLLPPTPSFVSQWKSSFQDAQYVVLSNPNDPLVPWVPGLRKWFSDHYHLLYAKHYIFIYEKNLHA